MAAIVPNFFSVERKGYTKVSDLFVDVMKDMLEHGFTFVNCSNTLSADQAMTYWQTTVQSSGTGHKVGEKLYVTDGTRPLYNGTPRPAPYVLVTSISNTGPTAGSVTGVTEVICDYDFPVWTVPPTGNVTLVSNISSGAASNVIISVANVEAVTYRTEDEFGGSTANVISAPQHFSFTLEAGGTVDPLNISDLSDAGYKAPADRQPWRVQFVISDEQKASGSVATSLQMSYDDALGKVKISQITDDFGTVIDNVGAIGAAQPGGIFSDLDLNQGFYNRKLRVANQEKTFPLSYMLSITNRGFFLGIYEGSWSTIRAATTVNSNYFNWVLVQRPVDRGTGITLTRGKAPVFHVNSVNYKYYKSVVREADILHPTSGPSPTPATGNLTITATAVSSSTPAAWIATGVPDTITGDTTKFLSELTAGSSIYDGTGNFIGTVKSIKNDIEFTFQQKPLKSVTAIDFFYTPPNIQALRVLADVHSPDSHMIFNSSEQVALTEDKTYLLSFPHNLTTPRFRYTEELDMIGTTSSDVVMSGQDIQFKTYSEAGKRTYRALPSNGALNTGLRMAVLWKPEGPAWVSPAEGNQGDIREGDPIDVTFVATRVPAATGDAREAPYYRLERGSFPAGLTWDPIAGRLTGQIAAADYSERTIIKFTIAAVSAESDKGYTSRDFWYTFVPQ